MSRESTNVDTNNMIEVVAGEVIADPENAKTIIPPNTSIEKDSPEEEEQLVIKLNGPEWPPRDNPSEKTNSDEGMEPGE